MNVDPREQGARPDADERVSGAGFRFAVVVSRFNESITARLLDGGLSALREAGVRDRDVEVFPVPGAFEIPLAAKRLATLGTFDAVVCIGAVIRGETPHFDFISEAVSRGVMEVSLQTGTPVIFGVLTTDTPEQAMERAGFKSHKGREAALAAVQMVNLMRRLK